MISVFSDDAKWAAMKIIVESWQGTPYRHLQCAKGRGADCVLFLGACHIEAGFLSRLDYEYYSRDWHLHTNKEFVLESFFEHAKEHMPGGYLFIEVDPENLMRGDLVCFSTTITGVSNHAGMVWDDGRMFHSAGRKGVHLSRFGRYFRERLTRAFRLMEGGGDGN